MAINLRRTYHNCYFVALLWCLFQKISVKYQSVVKAKIDHSGRTVAYSYARLFLREDRKQPFAIACASTGRKTTHTIFTSFRGGVANSPNQRETSLCQPIRGLIGTQECSLFGVLRSSQKQILQCPQRR